MMRVFFGLHALRFGELMEVYAESVAENGAEFYPNLCENEQILQARQDFYAYLKQGFFTLAGDRYCVWEEDGRYLCALRLQNYRDGLLLEALETHPQARRRGYAEKLIRAVQKQIGEKPLYSHISHRNAASIGVHRKCGFVKISDCAVYADGSVNDHCGTYRYQA